MSNEDYCSCHVDVKQEQTRCVEKNAENSRRLDKNEHYVDQLFQLLERKLGLTWFYAMIGILVPIVGYLVITQQQISTDVSLIKQQVQSLCHEVERGRQ